MNKPTWLTVADTADYFSVSVSLVRKLIREQKIKFYRVAGKIFIEPEDFMDAVIMVERFDTQSNEY